MSPAGILVAYLKGMGIVVDGPTADWSAFISHEPPEPNNCVTVIDATPQFDGRIMRTGQTIKHPGVQIRVRSLLYDPGWDKCEEIAKALDGIQNAVVGLNKINAASQKSGPIALGRIDTNNREVFTLNATLTIE